MVAQCINNIEHYFAQLMHTNYKILCTNIDVVSVMAAYAAITLTTSITTRTLVPNM